MVEKFNQPRAETQVLKHFPSREMAVEAVTIAGGSARSLEVGQVLAVYTGGANVGKYVEATVGAADGAATADAILLENVDVPASGDVQVVVAARLCVVDASELIYIGSPTENDKAAFLATLAGKFIIAR